MAQRDERGKNNATLKVVVGAAAVKREQPATFAVNVQILHREIKANKKGSALAKAHSEAELGERTFAYDVSKIGVSLEDTAALQIHTKLLIFETVSTGSCKNFFHMFESSRPLSAH